MIGNLYDIRVYLALKTKKKIKHLNHQGAYIRDTAISAFEIMLRVRNGGGVCINKVKGFAGKTMWIDLSSQSIREYPIEETVYRNFIGGRGLGAKILFDELPQDANPLGPENLIVINTGPLVGSPFFGIKIVLNTRSPLTGNYRRSLCQRIKVCRL